MCEQCVATHMGSCNRCPFCNEVIQNTVKVPNKINNMQKQ